MVLAQEKLTTCQVGIAGKSHASLTYLKIRMHFPPKLVPNNVVTSKQNWLGKLPIQAEEKLEEVVEVEAEAAVDEAAVVVQVEEEEVVDK